MEYIEKPRKLYACDRCCSKLDRAGQACPRCHRGVGVQVYPEPKHTAKEWEELRRHTGMFQGVKRK